MVEKYLDEYSDWDITSFKNAYGDSTEAVEVLTENTKYLVKISTKLEVAMANYDANDYVGFEDDDTNAILDLKIEEEIKL